MHLIAVASVHVLFRILNVIDVLNVPVLFTQHLVVPRENRRLIWVEMISRQMDVVCPRVDILRVERPETLLALALSRSTGTVDLPGR